LSNIAHIPQNSAITSSIKLMAVIADKLPPRLADGVPMAEYLRMGESVIGEHPHAVLDHARVALLSTKTFAPAIAEIVDEILSAYRVIGMPFSGDAKRLLRHRQRLDGTRYKTNLAGKVVFQDGQKVSLIGYINVFGSQANLIIEKFLEADAFDFERAISSVVKSFANIDKDDITANAVMSRFESCLSVAVLHRIKGVPSNYCNGVVADGPAYRFQPTKMESPYLCLSIEFVDRMKSLYPYARHETNHRTWIDGMYEVFNLVACQLKPTSYGTQEFQSSAEKIIERQMEVRNIIGQRLHDFELKNRNRQFKKNNETVMSAIAQIAAGKVVIDKIEIEGVRYSLFTLEECQTAKLKNDEFALRLA
jgi:hypothetical protein